MDNVIMAKPYHAINIFHVSKNIFPIWRYNINIPTIFSNSFCKIWKRIPLHNKIETKSLMVNMLIVI